LALPRTALIAVDVQNDYLPEGPLGSPDSDRIIEPLVEYATLAADVVILSRNLHPPDHLSFSDSKAFSASMHRPWPANCIKGTSGARIVSDLAAIAAKAENYVITKGLAKDQGGYSAFEGGTLRPLESLEDILRYEKITHIAIGGYWLDQCVAQTAFDASALGYSTAIEMTCTLPYPEFTPDSPERKETFERLARAGVICV
jgi:nicotinamidase/pyrazinamidase